MDAAVLRECAAARDGVGILDGSTLGKIDVQGPRRRRAARPALHQPDEQPEGRPVRYGVMCGVDGMVIDDGTVHAPGRRPVPGLHHHRRRGARSWTGWRSGCRPSGRTCGCTAPRSPSSGPRSRWSARAPATSSARCSPTSTSRNEAFPFMTWRDTSARRGARPGGPDQLLRRTRLRGERRPPGTRRRCGSGSSTPARPYGITPYGTETMHVLRAEKGYPIIGQDTDGTVTPQDLGMAGRCRRRSPTSSASGPSPAPRTRTRCASSSSGCCPSTGRPVLPEGSQIVEFCATTCCPPPPVPMLGHVTSSYRSAELGRTFALALVKGGPVPHRRDRPRARRRDRWCRWRSPARCSSTPKEPPRWLNTSGPHGARWRPWAARFARLPDSVAIAEEPFVAMVDVRLDPAARRGGSGGRCSVVATAHRSVHLREER